MEANRPTLLAKLAPLFGTQTENLAVEALGHILSESKLARRAVADVMRAGGADIGEVVQVRTQATGEDGARPDLVGFDERSAERLLIEAKFWAGLTDNQPVSYLSRLASDGRDPCVLLFVAPAARLEPLWNELLRLVGEAGLSPTRREDTTELRSAVVNDSTFLVLTSWRNLLHRMAAQVGAAGESHTETDIRQLQGLAEQQDDEAFLPLRPEEFGPQFPRRLRNLRGLVDDATDRACTKKIIGIENLEGKILKVTPQTYGYGRYVRIAQETPWFGVNHDLWARTGTTPLWLGFWSKSASVRRALEELRTESVHELWESLWVPIYLPVGKEHGAVLDAVVNRFRGIAESIQRLHPSLSHQTPEAHAEGAPG
ncbi:MAG: hypothetical protein OXE58_08350 [Acidobacteria bacterium]|nr:hypothetical protein [Acidobacteriota bacterium]